MDSTATTFDDRLRSGAKHIGWWLALRGLLLIMFGILALARPGAGILMLVAIFGFYALVDGMIALTAGFQGVLHGGGRALLFVEGIAGIVAGVLAFAWPGPAAVAVLVIVAIRAMVVGVLMLATALRMGHLLPNPWMHGIAGAASIVFGILLIARPGAGLLTLAWLVGIYALVVGIIELGAAFSLGGALRRSRPTTTAPLQPAT